MELINKLNSQEFLYLIILLVPLFVPIFRSYQSTDYRIMWSPLTMVVLVYFYYVILGPLVAIYNNDTGYRTIDHRNYLEIGYLGAIVSLSSIYIGFSILFKENNKIEPTKTEVPQDEKVIKLSKQIFFTCLHLLALSSGTGIIGKFNPLGETDSSVGYSGNFKQYLVLSMNTFTTASLLLLPFFLKGKYKKLYLIFTSLTFLLYVNEAFRYRLVILLFSSLIVYHLIEKRKLNLKLILGLGIPFLSLMGIMEVTRSYGKGLKLDLLDKKETNSLESSFNESKVFYSTGYLMANFSKVSDFRGLESFYTALAFPIPRKLWADKPDGDYLLGTIKKVYPGSIGAGVAFLNYGEYYICFGWAGIVIYSLLFGVFLKWGWHLYLKSPNDYFSIIFYALFSSFSYVVISRGYLPLTFVNYMFFVFPSYYLLKKSREYITSNRLSRKS